MKKTMKSPAEGRGIEGPFLVLLTSRLWFAWLPRADMTGGLPVKKTMMWTA